MLQVDTLEIRDPDYFFYPLTRMIYYDPKVVYHGTRSKKGYDIEVRLGKRVDYVNISREKDCISIKPKTWIDRSVWRKFNQMVLLGYRMEKKASG